MLFVMIGRANWTGSLLGDCGGDTMTSPAALVSANLSKILRSSFSLRLDCERTHQ